ncbi:DUF4825 domain-containing protein [Halalkalibacter krulwichiae]|uniref:DUF4825 domain-containing protein n=1 Tax=Halalkalibacter krulwichiae TaxID=199441 RepID=A0A1X9MMB9_9BACI|nr:DUF4825 domain-containing protein [Halalkalibacter krulwichiae]ARK32262.1 hypothetical protein BkAM31D_21725 [Halalkalibacter krulwichiae]
MYGRLKYHLFTLLAVLLLVGCSSTTSGAEGGFLFKPSNNEDTSAIGSVISELPNGENLERVDLHTEAPYGITITYKEIDKSTTLEDVVKSNAVFLFAFAEKAEWITFNVGEQTATVDRENIDKGIVAE